jgi:hypothetical protein
MQQLVENDMERLAVQLVGTVLDWWNSNGRDYMKLLIKHIRSVVGKYTMGSAIFDLSRDNTKQHNGRRKC